MKSIHFIFLALFAFIAISCDKKEELQQSSNVADIEVEITPYTNEVRTHLNALSQWKTKTEINSSRSSDGVITVNDQTAINASFHEVKQELLPIAQEFSSDLALSSEDYLEMYDVTYLTEEELEDAMVAALLFATTTDECIFELDDNGCMITRQHISDCFLEATGIAAGAVIIGHLSKGVVSKKILIQLIKLTAKIGSRTLNGIGLALIATEMAICLWQPF
ncbi:MAG: hypothetical protein K2G79_06450 [Muribaculum sp.]|nr:hypothetical protein [Muribaculum sp.]